MAGRLLLLLAIVVALISLEPTTACTRSLMATQGPAAAQQKQGGTAASSLLKDVYQFWLDHGPDKQYGGFHGTLDRKGSPMAPTTKIIVQQARHLWAFSTLLMAEPEKWGLSRKDARAAADTAYTFMRDKMMRDVQGGKLFILEATREGKAANPAINIYGNAFAIYGLSAFARATGSEEAKALALNTFKTLDKLYHSAKTGGWDETNTDDTFDSIRLGPSGSVIDDKIIKEGGDRSSAVPKRLSQSFNTLLHMAEALTELSKAVGGDPTVSARLLEVTQLLTGPMVIRPGKAGPNTPTAFIGPNYDPQTWKPVGPSYTNYGHNIEAAWLLGDAVDELQAKGVIDASAFLGKAAAMRAVLQEIGQAAIAAGYDTKNGGLFDGSKVGAASPTSPNKVWWAQAEAMLGFDWLYKRTRDAQYKSKLQETLTFVQSHLHDQEFGEWYWQTGPTGGVPLAYNAADTNFAATVKGNSWKASYHTGRALIRLTQAGY